MTFFILVLEVLASLVITGLLSVGLTWGVWLSFIATSGGVTYRQAIHHLATCSEPSRTGDGSINGCYGRCSFMNCLLSIFAGMAVGGVLNGGGSGWFQAAMAFLGFWGGAGGTILGQALVLMANGNKKGGG